MNDESKPTALRACADPSEEREEQDLSPILQSVLQMIGLPGFNKAWFDEHGDWDFGKLREHGLDAKLAEIRSALRACAEAPVIKTDPTVDECLAELARVRAENERLQRLVQTQRPELEQLRRVVTDIRHLHDNVPRQIEHLLEHANALLATRDDDLPTLTEMRGILGDGKSRVDAALKLRAEAPATDTGLTKFSIPESYVPVEGRRPKDFSNPGSTPSKWCVGGKDAESHSWCFNRNASETHCSCACHTSGAASVYLASEIDARLRAEALAPSPDTQEPTSAEATFVHAVRRDALQRFGHDGQARVLAALCATP